jgi:hypothetical protein
MVVWQKKQKEILKSQCPSTFIHTHMYVCVCVRACVRVIPITTIKEDFSEFMRGLPQTLKSQCPSKFTT